MAREYNLSSSSPGRGKKGIAALRSDCINDSSFTYDITVNKLNEIFTKLSMNGKKVNQGYGLMC